MRVRTAQFVMVPTWVMQHPEMRANGSRLAIYLAIRTIAFEEPDRVWRSDRELSVSVSEVAGLGSEACRKHITAMRSIGVILGRSGEMFLPSDVPESGDEAGYDGTHGGDDGTHAPITVRDRDKDPREDVSPVPSSEDPDKAVGKPTRREQATGIVKAWWDWYKERNGKSPLTNFNGAVTCVKSALEAGHEPVEIKLALTRLDFVSKHSLASQLGANHATKPTKTDTMDLLARAARGEIR